MSDKEFLGTEPIGKLIFKLSVPTVVAQLINMLYNMVDRMYIGHIPKVGELALAGLGVCLPIIMIVSAFAALVGSGSAPKASIAMGKKDFDTAEKILGGSFTIQFFISAILTAVMLIWNRDLLMAFGASDATIEYALSYMNIYALGTIFVQLTLSMNAFITAQGFAKTAMLSVLIGAIANIVLDPIFIFGFNMGVRGAALATIISQALSCIWVVSFLFGKKTLLKIRRKNLFVSPKLILPCLALGTATFIMQSSESIIFICFNSSLLKYGGDLAVGAMTVLGSVMQFAMLPLMGISQGAQPILSYNFGARNKARIKKAFKILCISCCTYSTILWLIAMIFPQALTSLFATDPSFIEFTAKSLRIYLACILLMGAQMACQITFVSLGNAKASILVAIVRKFVLLLPLIYIVPMFVENKTMGVYLAEPIADFIAVTFTVILFVFQFRKALKAIDDPNTKQPVATD